MATVLANYCADQHNDYFWLARNTETGINQRELWNVSIAAMMSP